MFRIVCECSCDRVHLHYSVILACKGKRHTYSILVKWYNSQCLQLIASCTILRFNCHLYYFFHTIHVQSLSLFTHSFQNSNKCKDFVRNLQHFLRIFFSFSYSFISQLITYSKISMSFALKRTIMMEFKSMLQHENISRASSCLLSHQHIYENIDKIPPDFFRICLHHLYVWMSSIVIKKNWIYFSAIWLIAIIHIKWFTRLLEWKRNNKLNYFEYASFFQFIETILTEQIIVHNYRFFCIWFILNGIF